MPVSASTGKLGKGKTATRVIKAYEAYCEGKTIFSNLWLKFPHVPIRTARDFLKIKKGHFLWDEGWYDADNRASSSAGNKLKSVLLLRSRKQEFEVGYTQQYFQIDIRIAFITDFWERPTCYPFDPEGKLKFTPEVIEVKRWDGEFNKLPDEIYEGNLTPYLQLYDTHRDPYTVTQLLSEQDIKEAVQEVFKEDSDTEEEYIKLSETARIKGKQKEEKLKEVVLA